MSGPDSGMAPPTIPGSDPATWSPPPIAGLVGPPETWSPPMAGLVGPPETWAPPQPVDVGSMAPTGAPSKTTMTPPNQLPIKPLILAGLNTIRRIKNDPELSSEIANVMSNVMAPLVKPVANIKREFFDPIVTYTRATPKGQQKQKILKKPTGKFVTQPKYNDEAQEGGAIEGVVPPERANGMVGMRGMPMMPSTSGRVPGMSGKVPAQRIGMTPKEAAARGMVASYQPSMLNQLFSEIKNISEMSKRLVAIDEHVSSLNENVTALLNASKPANVPQNNEQEGGRRRRQTKAKRKGRGRTRR